jgi:anti-anti-sigma factor
MKGNGVEEGQSSDCRIVVVDAQQRVEVHVAGELDLATAPRVVAVASEVLGRAANASRQVLELHLAEVSFCDSMGVHALLQVLEAATLAGVELRVARQLDGTTCAPG